MSSHPWSATAALLVSALGVGAGVRVAAQVPIQPPIVTEAYGLGGDLSRYEGQYGTPEFREVDDVDSWPRLQSIRTRGTFAAIPGRGPEGMGSGQIGRVMRYSNDLAAYVVCGHMDCVAIVPVRDLSDLFGSDVRDLLHKPVEVVGAVDNIGKPTPQRNEPVWAFLVWSIQLDTGHSGPPRKDGGSVLESLVRDPEAADGRPVTVRGVFRGANLFGDMPEQSRLHDGDWVLADGSFFVWVTGRGPKGSAFALDPRSRADCRWRLEVVGRAEARDGFVYVSAKEVRLLGLAREASARAPD
jgi:hypothetical protein